MLIFRRPGHNNYILCWLAFCIPLHNLGSVKCLMETLAALKKLWQVFHDRWPQVYICNLWTVLEVGQCNSPVVENVYIIVPISIYRKNRKLCGSFIVRFNGWHTHCYVDFFVRFLYLCVFLCTKNAGVWVFNCVVNHCSGTYSTYKSTHNFLFLRYIHVHVRHVYTAELLINDTSQMRTRLQWGHLQSPKLITMTVFST